jgi:hypothetical protein
MSQDNPSSKPFEARMRETLPNGAAHPEIAYTVHEYVLLAKLMLIEHRVREFTAADVVALAAVMESRDRELRFRVIEGGEK